MWQSYFKAGLGRHKFETFDTDCALNKYAGCSLHIITEYHHQIVSDKQFVRYFQNRHALLKLLNFNNEKYCMVNGMGNIERKHKNTLLCQHYLNSKDFQPQLTVTFSPNSDTVHQTKQPKVTQFIAHLIHDYLHRSGLVFTICAVKICLQLFVYGHHIR